MTTLRTVGIGAVLVIVGCGDGRAANRDGSPVGDADAMMIAFGSFAYHYQLRDFSVVVTIPAAGDFEAVYGGGTRCTGSPDAAARASFVALSLAPPTRQALADPAACPGTSDIVVESMHLQLAGGPTISKTMTERCTDGPILELRTDVRTLVAPCPFGFQDGSASP